MSEVIIHVLDGAFERVNRAGEHLENLHVRLEAFRQQHVDSIVTQFSPEPPHNIELVVQASAPMRIPILIGESCYNLRSALDYLIFELAKIDSGSVQNGTQFPIDDTPKKFKGHRETFLKGVDSHHVTMIEGLQPYAGCDWTKALRDLSNPDKHRQFTRLGLTVTGVAYMRSDPEFADSPLPIRRAPHPIAGEMDVKLDYTAIIRFPDGPLVTETLDVIKLKVAETLATFKPEFG